MGKNLIICCDGTGNQGGKKQGTNVWRVYNGIDRNTSDPQQITWYDDGVGTHDNKYIRALGAAFGFGFTRNVKEAYRFLCLNYVDGDNVFLFGFSRGAYTVRALAAFLVGWGRIDGACGLSDHELAQKIDEQAENYKKHRKKKQKNPDLPLPQDRTKLLVPIKALCVWDTVSALGTPDDFPGNKFCENRLPFSFKNNALDRNVAYGFHALALDDERRTFHPKIWKKRDDIEQVWFAGVHSNVGGGYPKDGMALVTLQWMIGKVTPLGLVFKPSFVAFVNENANVHDRQYNSRAGLGAFYRYEPRNLAKLMEHAGHVIIHESVRERIDRRTRAYNPGVLIKSGHDAVWRDTSKPLFSSKPSQGKLSAIQKTRKLCQMVFYGLLIFAALFLLAYLFGSFENWKDRIISVEKMGTTGVLVLLALFSGWFTKKYRKECDKLWGRQGRFRNPAPSSPQDATTA